MKFWKRWISDYRGKTQGLSLAEIGAYDILLDEYYAHERPLPASKDALYRICGAFTADEQKAVDSIVGRFFVDSPEGLRNKKADEYIADQTAYLKGQAERGKRGAAATWSKPDKDAVIHAKGNGAWWKTREGVLDMGQKLQLPPRTGEEMAAYKDRLFEAINAQRQSSGGVAGKFDD